MCYQKINNFFPVRQCMCDCEIIDKKYCHIEGMRSPFFDLLHRLLSFVTQFKYISLRDRGRGRERPTKRQTDTKQITQI